MCDSGTKKRAGFAARLAACFVSAISVVGVMVGLALSANGIVGDAGGA
jgi:hypothetical protein